MKKNNILEKVDGTYTKFVKWLIGEGNVAVHEKKDKKNTGLKDTYTDTKAKFLGLGTPNEKELLYAEVVKREKAEAKESKRIEKQLAKDKKEAQKANKKSSKKATSKKPATSKSATKKEVSKDVSKKKPGKASTTKSKSSTASKSETKKTSTKSSTKPKTTVAKATKKKTTSTAKKSAVEKEVSKKSSTKKSSVKKSTAKKTPKASSKPSKRDEKIALYAKDIKKHYGNVDKDFLTIIVKNLGPSIYGRDAELVSCSDPKELDTVRRNFLVKKLGLTASKSVLDAAIQDVCVELKAASRKYRATFYYTLAKKFKKESALS